MPSQSNKWPVSPISYFSLFFQIFSTFNEQFYQHFLTNPQHCLELWNLFICAAIGFNSVKTAIDIENRMATTSKYCLMLMNCWSQIDCSCLIFYPEIAIQELLSRNFSLLFLSVINPLLFWSYQIWPVLFDSNREVCFFVWVSIPSILTCNLYSEIYILQFIFCNFYSETGTTMYCFLVLKCGFPCWNEN